MTNPVGGAVSCGRPPEVNGEVFDWDLLCGGLRTADKNRGSRGLGPGVVPPPRTALNFRTGKIKDSHYEDGLQRLVKAEKPRRKENKVEPGNSSSCYFRWDHLGHLPMGWDHLGHLPMGPLGTLPEDWDTFRWEHYSFQWWAKHYTRPVVERGQGRSCTKLLPPSDSGKKVAVAGRVVAVARLPSVGDVPAGEEAVC